MNALIHGWVLILVRDQFVCAQQVDDFHISYLHQLKLWCEQQCFTSWLRTIMALEWEFFSKSKAVMADHNLTVSQGVGTQVVVQIPGNGFNVDTALSRCS